MNPNQPPQPQDPHQTYPPQAVPPSQGYPGQQQPVQASNPYQQPQQQPQTGHPSWYTPPQTNKPEGPASASDYVQRAQATQTPDPNQLQMQGQQANGSHSIDYLNKIAGTTPVPRTSATAPNQKIVLMGVGVFLALALAVFLLVFTSQKGPISSTPPEKTLYTTIFNNSQITKTANKNIKNSKLASLNSSYNGQLLNDLTAMSGPLAKGGISAKDLEKSAKAAKAFDKTLVTLNDARLNATYDKAYANEMEYQIGSIILLMEKVQKLSNNKAMVTYIKSDMGNYKTLQEGLKSYHESLVPSN